MLVLEVRGVSLEITLTIHLNRIRDPRPHNSPPEPHFSLSIKKDEVLANKLIDKGTFVNRSPYKHVFSTDCDSLLMLQNPQLRNKCNWWPAVSHVLR